MADINTLGKTVSTGSDASIGMPAQNDCPYESNSTGKMRRSKSQGKIFDNNGGDSKAGGAGVVDNNAEYGPVTYGF
jgi:hypothetical protein